MKISHTFITVSCLMLSSSIQGWGINAAEIKAEVAQIQAAKLKAEQERQAAQAVQNMRNQIIQKLNAQKEKDKELAVAKASAKEEQEPVAPASVSKAPAESEDL